MRDQYAGDISDVLKFGLLRALARSDRILGVAWYYAPGNDGRADGRHQEWVDEEAWYHLDHKVAHALQALPQRSVEALQCSQLWPPGSLFHREPMPHISARAEWASRKRDALDACDLIFLDPDNGIGTDPEKHATFAEVQSLRKSGRAIVFITFPKREKYDLQLRALHERVRSETGSQDVFTMRTSVMVQSSNLGCFVPRARWFTIVDADSVLLHRAQSFAVALSSIRRVKATIE